MTALTARFCVGCGQVLDDLQPSDSRSSWITAVAYREKYGCGLTDLHLRGEACPPCARALAIGRRESPTHSTSFTAVISPGPHFFFLCNLLGMRSGKGTSTMDDARHKGQEETGPTLLELVLRLEGDFRRRLEPIRVTPLQAGMILFLRRHAKTRVTDAAAALSVRPPTLSEVVNDLVRKQWITKRRSVTDARVVHLSLSRRGNALALQIEQRVRHVEATLPEDDRGGLGRTSSHRRA